MSKERKFYNRALKNPGNSTESHLIPLIAQNSTRIFGLQVMLAQVSSDAWLVSSLIFYYGTLHAQPAHELLLEKKE